MVNVQCLNGPLLWVTESEMSRKAERIRLKDLSERDDTSSDVIPFVSIFGRILNLMVPTEAQNFTVRSLTEHQGAFCIEIQKQGKKDWKKLGKIKDSQAELPDLNCFSFRR